MGTGILQLWDPINDVDGQVETLVAVPSSRRSSMLIAFATCRPLAIEVIISSGGHFLLFFLFFYYYFS